VTLRGKFKGKATRGLGGEKKKAINLAKNKKQKTNKDIGRVQAAAKPHKMLMAPNDEPCRGKRPLFK